MALWRSFCAGFLGSLASLVGKISLSSDSFLVTQVVDTCKNAIFIGDFYCQKVSIIIRAMCFLLMLACNGMMLAFFLQALEKAGSLPVTVMNSSVGFVFTGLFGVFIFDEEMTTEWMIGAILIIIGIGIISYSQAGQKRIE